MKITSNPTVIYSSSVAVYSKETKPALETIIQPVSVSATVRKDKLYDFTNMSVRERRDAANQLLKCGQITLDEAPIRDTPHRVDLPS